MTKQDQWYLEKDFKAVAAIINDLQERVSNLEIKISDLYIKQQQVSVEPEVKPEIAKMTIDELYAEYEQNLEITLSERDKIIFRYAYFIGKNNLDKKE